MYLKIGYNKKYTIYSTHTLTLITINKTLAYTLSLYLKNTIYSLNFAIIKVRVYEQIPILYKYCVILFLSHKIVFYSHTHKKQN